MAALEFALAFVSLLLLVPALVLLLQVVCAVLQRRRPMVLAAVAVRPKVCVLVPAHNESRVIAQSLRAIARQLRPGDRLLVVADNCVDDTAAIASGLGAEVLVRRDASRRGKGFALAAGVAHLEPDPPEVLIVVDADCEIADACLDHLAALSCALSRSVQALYAMRAPAERHLARRLAEFAWRVKNHVRPLGFAFLGWPCQLMGTGMAFPWYLARRMPLASASIVEDMKLGADLAIAGHPPAFCPQARVTSEFPHGQEAAGTQRTRWEHGHLETIVSQLPRLLMASLARRDARLLAFALDLAVPPLALLVLCLLICALAGGILAGFGAPALLAVLAALPLMIACSAILVAWRFWGRDLLSAADLLSVHHYVLAKLPLYVRFFTRREKAWVKTARD